ncbi:MAG: anti-sigma factor [Hyphomicrobiaceae bacterium]|nr:anti-sigma factor [Hyphomicrobiaceae bacterium]
MTTRSTGEPAGSPDPAIEAGVYVLGLMEADEARRFEEAMARDASTRAGVAFWRDRLMELDISAPPVEVGDKVWSQILASLDRPAAASFVDLADRRGSAPPRRGTMAAFWQGAMAASLVALMAAGLAYTYVKPAPPRLVVVLLDSGAQPVSIVEAVDSRTIRIVPLGDLSIPAGKSLQVWTLPTKELGPISMGLLPGPGTSVLTGPALPEPKPEQLYEITVEPEGGSPTGRPTGPILGKGFAKVPQI